MCFETSQIELSGSALRANLRFLRKMVGPDAEICGVVKGNAYGHGIGAFVPLAESCGLKTFAVANASEALAVVNSRTAESEVIIMSWVENDALEWAIRNGIQFYVFNLSRLKTAIALATRVGAAARIHLELETGFNRVGLDADGLRVAVDTIKSHAGAVRLEGVCTHFAGAESVANDSRVRDQIGRFNEHCRWIEGQSLTPRRRHTACSAAALTYPETILDMARLGIAMYGFWPSKETQMHYLLAQETSFTRRPRDPLRRVLRWTSRIMNIKRVSAGDFVGYGTIYLTTRVERIAAIPVGYADGFARGMSNNGYVLIRGRRAAVVGYVNMSVLLVDVTDVADAAVGDEVVLIGSQGKRSVTVASFSDLSRSMNYEVLVRLPAGIPRTIVE
ncbi:MAG: alanine racemase [Phycisphaerae bacterium]|nr:alanine racemase [Phycisphaerae bacterium]